MVALSAILLAVFFATQVTAVEPADLAFGREQVERFMHDRPDTADVINRNPALKQQLEILFADDGQRSDGQAEQVHWNNQEPPGSFSDCRSAWGDYRAEVRVTSGANLSPEDKCACLVFELHNVRNGRLYNALNLMVFRHQISREDFARSIVRCEFETLKKTREFFVRYPLVDANLNEDTEYSGIMRISGDFSDYMRRVEMHSAGADYVNNYRQQYDRMFSPESESKSDQEKVATWATHGSALTVGYHTSIFARLLNANSADTNASDSIESRTMSAHVWGDALDWTVTVTYFALILSVLVVGYGSMGLHIRDYYRSLRRALVVIGKYSRELPGWILRDRPRCIQALDLSLPCTTSEVLVAYRKKVKLLHPDRGGDPREFLRLQEHFEQAMALAGD